MKILAAGDIHGDTSLAKKLADRAVKEKAELVILCGDITQFEQSTDNLIGPFVKKKKKVLLIPGNHESIATADFLAEMYGVKNIDGYYVQYKNIAIFGSGGANVGPNISTEEQIFKKLQKSAKKIKPELKKIMVTHVHPHKSKMSKFTRFFPGSTGVTRAISKFKPDILLCSHVHEAEGLEEKIGNTKVINVGRSGKIIEI